METPVQRSLLKTIFHVGFGDKLKDLVIAGTASGASNFDLAYPVTIDGRHVGAHLHFSRAAPGTDYCFEYYQLSVDDKTHVFRLSNGWGITLKEGYNLLCGRAVHKQWLKDETKVKEWVQLDLTDFNGESYTMHTWTEDYDFDIEKAVNAIDISLPSSNWDMAMLYRSLERGNLQAVTLRQSGIATQAFICANPKDKNILIYPEAKNDEEMELHADSDDIEAAMNRKNFRKRKPIIK